jgi:hypothetical protein
VDCFVFASRRVLKTTIPIWVGTAKPWKRGIGLS